MDLSFGRFVKIAGFLAGTARIHVREIRNFYRHPRRIRFVRTGGPELRVVLYGIPFDDWNRALASIALWQPINQVTEVVRVPAWAFLAPGGKRPTIFIPMKDRHAARLPHGARALASRSASVDILSDKAKFAAYLSANGLGDYCPATYPDPEVATYPCVLKRVDLSASVGISMVHSRAHTISEWTDLFGRRYLLQELVPGRTECVTYFLLRQGHVLWTCSFATDMDGPAVVKHENNGHNRRVIETPANVVNAVEKILTPLAYSGFCTTDYKILESGVVKIIEINPRFGGTLLSREYVHQLRSAIVFLLSTFTR